MWLVRTSRDGARLSRKLDSKEPASTKGAAQMAVIAENLILMICIYYKLLIGIVYKKTGEIRSRSAD